MSDSLAMDLTSKQWDLIKQYLPEPKSGQGKPGRPPTCYRKVLNGILWIHRTGAPWKDLPRRYAPYQTCHRRFQSWVKKGIFRKILEFLVIDLESRGKIKTDETYIDGTFSEAKKGAWQLVLHAAAKGPRSWQSQTAMVFQSGYPYRVLVRMKRRSLRKQLKNCSP